MFIWERADWPHFTWSSEALLPQLGRARLLQGRLLGELGNLGFALRREAELVTSVVDIITTSAIEGESLAPASVRSSVAHRLGVAHAALPKDRRVEGLVDVVLDATAHASKPLTEERLLGWHAELFPTGRSNFQRIVVGAYRDDASGPMQVVSGLLTKREVVHFEAPPAKRLKKEMKALLTWLKGPSQALDGLVASGLAHLWFVTVHPFDDGNGRIARALADLVLARADGVTQRFWSMSAQLERDRSEYYRMLEKTQRGGLDVTEWLSWFIDTFERCLSLSATTLKQVTVRNSFWRAHETEAPFNERQQKMLRNVLEQDTPEVTVKQWAAACKCSIDSAGRDIADLVARGVLTKNEGGSSRTSYRFSWSMQAE
ncbi:MAG: Fic family protein [Archangium sp.]